MMARNPTRMDYYKKYQNIIADYNREKDRATVEETFANLIKLVADMDDEALRHVREGLTEEEPPFTDEEAEALAERLYGFVWQQSEMAA